MGVLSHADSKLLLAPLIDLIPKYFIKILHFKMHNEALFHNQIGLITYFIILYQLLFFLWFLDCDILILFEVYY
jgi:hypothetical protein